MNTNSSNSLNNNDHINTSNDVWIVDDDRSIRWVLERALAKAGIPTLSFERADTALAELANQQPEVIISDIRMPGTDGLTMLTTLQAEYPALPVIIMTAHSDLDSAVSSYQSGAFDYLPKPFDINEAIKLVQRALAHAQEQKAQQQSDSEEQTEWQQNTPAPEIIGAAPAMQEVFRAIGRLSHSHITVLINGESGTGKELVAHALHRHSPRANNAFIPLNMAAIPKELIESELFGHEKGAFTGANQTHRGRFEQAHGGTLFLDEIGDMPAEVQTRLLRVLANGEFYRVGGHTPISVNVRIIAATHQNLEQLVAEGQFREDLFHRLNVIRIHLPRLAERKEDIAALIRHFLEQAAIELESEPKQLHPDTLSFMTNLPWPGNVRQLENTCRWLTVMAAGREVLVSDLPPELNQQQTAVQTPVSDMAFETVDSPTLVNDWQSILGCWADQQLLAGQTALLDTALPMLEKTMIEVALRHTGGRRQDAAKLLGWGRNTLTRKIKELDMDSQTHDSQLC